MNPRKDLGDLTELIDSIRKQGILQNLTVVNDPEASNEFERFIAVIGHRRLAAAKSAGLTQVPCNIVEMTMQEQLVTMMSENMQRADLTPYEQAHGFQTMLDFGEDVESITVKTGFSESTVRRRLKLLELDQPKLKAAVDKGVSLLDLMRLEKIEDRQERDKVLAEIGTNNFEYKFKCAIDNQEGKKRTAERLTEIKGWAREATGEEWKAALRYDEVYAWQSNRQIKEPNDSKEVQYIYKAEGSWIYVRKLSGSNQDSTEEEKRKQAEEERRKDIRNRYELLKQVHESCRQIRRQYVLSISEKAARSLQNVVMRRLLHNAMFIYGSPDANEYKELIGLKEDSDEGAEEDIDGCGVALLVKNGDAVEQIGLRYAYFTLDDEDKNVFDWQASFVSPSANSVERFTELKEFMNNIGYQMSDEEKSLFDGTHPLYTKKEEGK